MAFEFKITAEANYPKHTCPYTIRAVINQGVHDEHFVYLPLVNIAVIFNQAADCFLFQRWLLLICLNFDVLLEQSTSRPTEMVI